MDVFFDTLLLSFAALFPIVNPVGGAPLFLGLTQFCTEKERRSLALRVATNSFFLLLCENFRKQFTQSKNRYSFIYGGLEEKIDSNFGTYCEQGTNSVHP